jgi:hypothetical protein
MVIAKFGDGVGNSTLLLGISRPNLEMLMEGKPILKKAADLGTNCDIVIVGGESEDQILDDMRKLAHIPDEAVEDRRN